MSNGAAGTTVSVLIMAGGTGGHVFPALAVARELARDGVRVEWLGTPSSFESRLVPGAGFAFHEVPVSGLRGKGMAGWLKAPFALTRALLLALRALKRLSPDLVLGMGGYATGPGGVAARLLGKPLVIHEQNAVAGTTNRLLARLARRVFEAFPGSFPGGIGAETIGNPVRDSIVAAGAARRRTTGMPPRLLVLGGSQGALALNTAVPQALALLTEAGRPQVRHQAGRSLETAERSYREAGVTAECVAFIDDMAAAYAWADIVVARAGALTLSELAAAGVGAILVPYPHAVDDHQARNAGHFAAAGAAIVIPQGELGPERLARELGTLLGEPGLLTAMGERCRSLMHADAARKLADACIELAGGRA